MSAASSLHSASSSSAPSSPIPPSYSPPDASPPYASEPSDDEQRLDYVARVHSRIPHGVYTKSARRLSVALKHQEDGLDAPVYVRHSIVAGDIIVEDKDVCSVSIKLEGRHTMSLVEGGSSSRLLFSTKHSLWRRSESQTQCPRAIPFLVPFPATYETKTGEVPMPPSFEASFTGSPGLRVQIFYFLSIRITRPPLSLWRRHTTIVIPVKYQPRSRPYLPISPGLYPFLSTVKTAPEEWHQISSTVSSRDQSVDPLECHLFIPSVQIYGLPDIIPFHIQVAGAAKSLSSLVGSPAPRQASKSPTRRRWSRTSSSLKSPYPTELSKTISRASSVQPTKFTETCAQYPWSVQNPYLFVGGTPEDLTSLHSVRTRERDEFVLRVYLLRQVSTKINGQKAWRNQIIGEGSVYPAGRPPDFDQDDARPSALDWAGEVRVDKDVYAPSFTVGDLTVKDFLVVQLTPSRPDRSPLTELQLAHPIRLVTDTYRDIPDPSQH
ncbi:hypothetical protein PsYK624_152530 [Phanerochaete sordida]|uniref:Uncharacterized protein n=1 Tax=Phanerochaete sordida TaxID=48140 RepID=A0A9P3GSZ3_9APHY|nr:hypothetical protein PsYK624_152530 [Phanerochaete sordida]